MARRSWTTADERMLAQLYPRLPLAEVAARLGRTEKAIRSRAKLLRVSRTGRRPWSAPELATLRQLYPDTPTAQIAEQLGRSLTTVYQVAQKLGLAKSAAYLASPAACRLRRGDGTGAATRFKPGHRSWNKGTHFVAGGRSAETQFKPGRAPHEARNYVPIGSYRLSKDGYLERKITDDQSLVPARRWVAVHRLVWIEEHGEIPENHVVTFLPGMHTQVLEEITIDRLELLTRQELMQRNTIQRYPPELRETMRLLGRVRKAIKRRAA